MCRLSSNSLGVLVQSKSVVEDTDDDDEYSDVYEILGSQNKKVVLDEPQARTPAPGRRDARHRMSILESSDVMPPKATPIGSSSRRSQRLKKYTIDDFQLLKVLGKGSFGKVLYYARI